jgi:Conserved TM helix.
MPSTYLAQADTGFAGGGGGTSFTIWTDAVLNSLTDLWAQFIAFLPSLIAALIVFFIGWAISVAIGRLVEKILVVLRVNSAFESIKGLRSASERAGLSLNVPRVVGEIAKWFLLIVTLLATTDILGLREVSSFLSSVLLYIPNVVVAALILVIAVLLANFVYRTVLASVDAAGFTSGGMVAAISKWAIIVFALFAALLQLNVATALIQTILTAFFAMVALAGGLSFGLGGKEMAAKWLKKAEEDIAGRK